MVRGLNSHFALQSQSDPNFSSWTSLLPAWIRSLGANSFRPSWKSSPSRVSASSSPHTSSQIWSGSVTTSWFSSTLTSRSPARSKNSSRPIGGSLGLAGIPDSLPSSQHVIEESHTDKQSVMLLRTDEPILDPAWTVKPVTLEDLVLAYMGQARSKAPRRRSGIEVLR